MNNLNQEKIPETPAAKNGWGQMAVTIIAVSAFAMLFVYHIGSQEAGQVLAEKSNKVTNSLVGQDGEIAKATGIELPIKWENIGKQMVDTGVIDQAPFEQIYASRGGLLAEDKNLLLDSKNQKIVMTTQNSGYLLNLLWAFGLANKNQILEKGPMNDTRYGGAGNFASTGGWTLAKGNPMDHYSKHEMIKLTPEQQALVESVSKNIYRPCCGNSTYFPDCNHGMAMLGLLELMAANGVSEAEMYKVALQVNTLWFPDTYLTINKYLQSKGLNLGTANPKEILGADFSSAYGYANILNQIQTPEKKSSGGGGCGV